MAKIAYTISTRTPTNHAERPLLVTSATVMVAIEQQRVRFRCELVTRENRRHEHRQPQQRVVTDFFEQWVHARFLKLSDLTLAAGAIGRELPLAREVDGLAEDPRQLLGRVKAHRVLRRHEVEPPLCLLVERRRRL